MKLLNIQMSVRELISVINFAKNNGLSDLYERLIKSLEDNIAPPDDTEDAHGKEAIKQGVSYGDVLYTLTVSHIPPNKYYEAIKIVRKYADMTTKDAKEWCDVVRGCKNPDSSWIDGIPNSIELLWSKATIMQEELKNIGCCAEIDVMVKDTFNKKNYGTLTVDIPPHGLTCDIVDVLVKHTKMDRLQIYDWCKWRSAAMAESFSMYRPNNKISRISELNADIILKELKELGCKAKWELNQTVINIHKDYNEISKT